MPKTLRPYQQAAVEAVFDWFGAGRTDGCLIVAPVASGKSLIQAEIVKRIHADAPNTKIVMLTNTQELLKQNGDELAEHIPNIDYGYYCAALGEKKLHNDVTLASIQSIHKKIGYLSRVPQVLIIDEVHTVSHNEDTLYRKFIEKCKEFNPNLAIIGLTGTPFRMDSGRIDEGENSLFKKVAYEIDIGWLIEQGYLCRPITPKVKTGFDISGVKIIKGDYAVGMLEKAVNVDDTTKACVKEIIEHGVNRKKWIVFTAGVLHCEAVYDAMCLAGVSCDMVTGKTPKVERRQIIEDYKSGKIKCLINVATMTTGFNAPEIDLVAFMRPTRSLVLYIQMVGRGLRLASDKENALLLDFGRVVEELGPIDDLYIRRKRPSRAREKTEDEEKEPQAIMKRCPSCATECAANQRYCYSCSYSFINQNIDIETSQAAVLSIDVEPEWHDVVDVQYMEYTKKNAPEAPTTLRVSYSTQAMQANEWICFNHPPGGYAHDKAVAWHEERFPQCAVPISVKDSLNLLYPKPDRILVKKEGGFWRVIDCEFGESDNDIQKEFEF